ncbi:MAG: hypothetical protein HKN04_15380 [Rhodothermaceae bacterium]|nr:hypothetical protein [Rhodothermaceae bacterium]
MPFALRSVRLLVAFLVSALWIAGPAAHAQVLEGRITDAETTLPLAGATAQEEGGEGVVADAAGRFRLQLASLPTTVVVRFVGYEPDTLRLRRTDAFNGVIRRAIALQPVATPLDDVTVTDENPAVNILRRVLARKAELKPRVVAYAAEGYGRFVLERWGLGETFGTPVRLTEALSNVYWRWPGGGREEVVARRRIPEGGPFRYAALDAVPDFFFDDTVVLDDVRYLTPTHPDAVALYDVRLGEITEADGLRFFDIALAPRRGGVTGFRGRIRVVDSLFVIAEAELRPDRLPRRSMVTDFEASYRVTFSPVSDGIWLPERFEREGRVQVGTAGVRIPTVHFRQTTLITNRQLGLSGPSMLWATEDRYYSPAGVYGGREVHLPFRDQWPLDEAVAQIEPTFGRYELKDLFWREGILRRYVPIPIEGRDDATR